MMFSFFCLTVKHKPLLRLKRDRKGSRSALVFYKLTGHAS
jgi:hypothetical protein